MQKKPSSNSKKPREHVDKFNDDAAQMSRQLSPEDARRLKGLILDSVGTSRKAIYYMFCGGYKALGYSSFKEFVESLSLDHSTVYRQKNAAIIELRLRLRIGTIKNESVIRDLYRFSAEECRLIMRTAVGILKESGKKTKVPTAKMVNQAIIELGLANDKLKRLPDEQKSLEIVKKNVQNFSTTKACLQARDALKQQFLLIKSRGKSR